MPNNIEQKVSFLGSERRLDHLRRLVYGIEPQYDNADEGVAPDLTPEIVPFSFQSVLPITPEELVVPTGDGERTVQLQKDRWGSQFAHGQRGPV